MVGGTEWVIGPVVSGIFCQILEHVRNVVVAAGVLECDRLVAVDVPDDGVLDQLHRCFVSKNVVEAAQLAVKLI